MLLNFLSTPSIVLISSISASSLPLLSQGFDLAASEKLLNRQLKDASFNGAIFYYDEQNGKIETAITDAYYQNPEIYDRLTQIFGSTPNNVGHMPASARKNGWQIEPRWWVVNKHGVVTFSSDKTPTEDEILKQLTDASIQEFSQILKNYIKENPYRQDALIRLVHQQLQVAARRMKKHLVSNDYEQSPWPEPKLRRPLTVGEDDEIWSDYAETLKLVFETEAWTASKTNIFLFPWVTRSTGPEAAMIPGSLMALSPKMRALAAQWLPKITQIVKELPEDFVSWGIWLVLEKASGGSGSAIPSILNSIKLRPGVPDRFPPPRVLLRMMENSDNFIHIEKYWETQFEASMLGTANPREGDVRYTWVSVRPLLEVYLKQNADGKAEMMLKTFIEWSKGNCKTQLEQAVGIAKRYNKTSLATYLENVDLDSIQRNAVGNSASEKINLSWIVIEEDDSDNLSAAFNKEITSYLLDSLPASVKVEKRGNPQFAHIKPGWGLINSRNAIIEYTEEHISSGAISAMAKRNGIVSKIEEYEAFRRTNDRNAYLELFLLMEYVPLANKRMAKFNQSNPDKPMLSEEEDNIIWGPIAKILEEWLSNGRYKLLFFRHQIPDVAIQSPIMKRMAARMIYQLQEFIKRDPESLESILFWPGLNALTENRHSLIDLFSGLTPIPGQFLFFNTNNNSRAMEILNEEALKREEWDFIITHSIPHWDYWGFYWGNGSRWNENSVWNILGPLIEALLAKNDVAGADRIFTEFMDSISSQTIQRRLVEIATKRNKPDLARKWAAMRSTQ